VQDIDLWFNNRLAINLKAMLLRFVQGDQEGFRVGERDGREGQERALCCSARFTSSSHFLTHCSALCAAQLI
jgi:hypothetical protein